MSVTVVMSTNMSDVDFVPAAWSILSMPAAVSNSLKMTERLINTPTSRHVTLIVNRGKRAEKIAVMKNITNIHGRLEFLDSVNLVYERSGGNSSKYFNVMSESGYLFHKGERPDLETTQWFSVNKATNASNCWDLGVQPNEKKYLPASSPKRFNWELCLLMSSLSGSTSEYRRFIYGLPLTEKEDYESLLKFCEVFNYECQLIVSDNEQLQLAQSVLGV